MDTLTEIVKTVLVIIVIASLLELLLPDNGLKPFVNFTMSLFLLIAILNPVLNAVFHERDFDINLWDHKNDQTMSEKMIEKGLDINQQVMQSNDGFVQEKVQGQIMAITSLVPGVEGVDARIKPGENGAIEKIKLLVKTQTTAQVENNERIGVFSNGAAENLSREEQERIKEKILLLLDNMYGIEAGQIEIKFEGGDI